MKFLVNHTFLVKIFQPFAVIYECYRLSTATNLACVVYMYFVIVMEYVMRYGPAQYAMLSEKIPMPIGSTILHFTPPLSQSLHQS